MIYDFPDWGTWNWIWPVCLLLGSAFAVRHWQIRRPKDRFFRVNCVLFLLYTCSLILYCRLVGLPVQVLFSWLVISTFFYQALVSVTEELLYRQVGIEFIARNERSEYPWFAFIGTSTMFGLSHGLNPILLGTGSFGWAYFAGTFVMGLALAFIYFKSKSVSLVGLVHFLINTIGIFIIPTSKLIDDLSSAGRILF